MRAELAGHVLDQERTGQETVVRHLNHTAGVGQALPTGLRQHRGLPGDIHDATAYAVDFNEISQPVVALGDSKPERKQGHPGLSKAHQKTDGSRAQRQQDGLQVVPPNDKQPDEHGRGSQVAESQVPEALSFRVLVARDQPSASVSAQPHDERQNCGQQQVDLQWRA